MLSVTRHSSVFFLKGNCRKVSIWICICCLCLLHFFSYELAGFVCQEVFFFNRTLFCGNFAREGPLEPYAPYTCRKWRRSPFTLHFLLWDTLNTMSACQGSVFHFSILWKFKKKKKQAICQDPCRVALHKAHLNFRTEAVLHRFCFYSSLILFVRGIYPF